MEKTSYLVILFSYSQIQDLNQYWLTGRNYIYK